MWGVASAYDRSAYLKMEAFRAVLRLSHVKLLGGDVEKVVEKLTKMCNGGASSLLVISDFDMTLSRYYINGKRGCTSYSVIESSPLMPEELGRKANTLKMKYAPIENNKDLSLEERTAAMKEWFERAHELLIEFSLPQRYIAEMVSTANIGLRPGYEQLFTMLENAEVPLLIFSAGISNTIYEILKLHSGIRSNMKVISNTILFDESGTASNFTVPVLHSYSKGNSPEQFVGVKKFIEGRHNVVLLGDSLGDPGMVGGLDRVDHVIKIGFLNHDVEKLLTTYLQMYDIVLTGDADMNVVNTLLRVVLQT